MQRDMFTAISFVVVGLAFVTTMLWIPPPQPGSPKLGYGTAIIFLWFGGGAMIGAGLFAPFGKKLFGAIFGLFAPLFAYLVALLVDSLCR